MIECRIRARQFVIVANKTDTVFALRELIKGCRRYMTQSCLTPRVLCYLRELVRPVSNQLRLFLKNLVTVGFSVSLLVPEGTFYRNDLTLCVRTVISSQVLREAGS